MKIVILNLLVNMKRGYNAQDISTGGVDITPAVHVQVAQKIVSNF